MEITIEELNILLQKEFERGKSSNQTMTYIPNMNFDYKSSIPEPCKSCPIHPSNGGSGMCNCILGDTTTCSIDNKKERLI